MIPDPLSASITVIKNIESRSKEAKINQEGCKLLGELALQMLPILESLDPTTLDRAAQMGIEDVKNALDYASLVVERCCTTNIFSAIIHNQDHGLMLKRAADDLVHALQQMPLANLTTSADIASGINEIAEKLKNSEFREKAAVREQTEKLKKELEKAFFNSTEENESVKDLIDSLVGMHEFTKEELEDKLLLDLDSLKAEAENAKNSKEKQLEFEFDQVIKVISATIGEASEESIISQKIEDQLCCPISKTIMTDPVVLKETGMTYDRSSIMEWFQRGHRYDPLTKIELKTKEFIPNRAIQDICRTFLEITGGSSITEEIQGEKYGSQIPPGLYQGHGKFFIGLELIHTTQLLILQPNGLAFCCTLYDGKDEIIQINNMEKGRGEWDNETLQLSIKDNCFHYNGSVNLGTSPQHLELEFQGKVSLAGSPNKEYDFQFVCSSPSIEHSIWARPGIIQMENYTIGPQKNTKNNSTTILVLEADSSVNGSMWFESASNESTGIGHIVGGRWDTDGSITYTVHFSLKDRQLDSETDPKNHFASFKILGTLIEGNKDKLPSFEALVVKNSIENIKKQENETPYLPLDDLKLLEYPYLRNASVPWYCFGNSPLDIFQA
eukprot:g94.t1